MAGVFVGFTMGINRDTLSRESVAFTIMSLGWPSASMIIVVEATTVAVTASVPLLPPLDCAITEVNVSMRTTERIDDLTHLLDPASITSSLNVFMAKRIAFKQPRPITRATRT